MLPDRSAEGQAGFFEASLHSLAEDRLYKTEHLFSLCDEHLNRSTNENPSQAKSCRKRRSEYRRAPLLGGRLWSQENDTASMR
jgi:hypothetical protein